MSLSKSRFTKGMQCRKALWLATHRKELADLIDAATQLRFDDGTRVGRVALGLHPDGVEVTQEYWQYDEALATTKKVLAQDQPAVFEGAFKASGVFVRPDILVRVGPGEYDLYEVKSSTQVKDQHVWDVGIQTYVLEKAGLRIRRSYLTHIDRDYVYAGGAYAPEDLLAATDLTAETRLFMQEVPALVAEMHAVLKGDCPEIRVGGHCKKPYACDFRGHCFADLPDYPVTSLCFVREHVLEELLDAGIWAVRDIPLDFPGLQERQRQVIEVAKSGNVKILGDLRRSLAAIEHPIFYLDFETVRAALPLYPGTRPYQQVPFQWSCHVRRSADAELEHHEFLHQESSDPQRAFAESMLALLGEKGSIVAHHDSFEQGRIKELATALPDLSKELRALLPRFVDREKIVKDHVKHPGFRGSTSLKAVLPALCPNGCSYKGLTIADGDAATIAYRRFLEDDELSAEETAAIFEDLRTYCGVDTEAMVRIHDALSDLDSYV
jgi:hypothetical protein